MPVYPETNKVDGQTRWFIRTYVKDQFGQSKQIKKHNPNWIGREGKKEAEREESRLKNEINYFEKNINLSKLISKYLEYKKPMVKYSTYEKLTQDIKYYIAPYSPVNKKITEINSRDILHWQENLNKINLSITTKKRVFTTFSSIMRHGTVFYNLEKNVVKQVDNFKMPKSESKKEMNFLTLSEFNDFISFEKNTLYKAFFTILFYTGMRRGELLALTLNDIDFDNNTITINKTYNPKYEKFGIGSTSPKTQRSIRKLKMLEIVKQTILSLKTTSKNERIFQNVTLTTLKRKCDLNCKSANINKAIRIHDFRHSFASMCIDKNVPIAILSSYLGHESISITLDIYSHLYPDSQNKLIEMLS